MLSDHAIGQLYREWKDNVVQEFGSLCVEGFRDIFVEEAPYEFSEGRRLSKYEALFAGTAGARQWQRTVVEEACLMHSFNLLL